MGRTGELLSNNRFRTGAMPEGGGSHRLTIAGHIGSCNDPDGFIWER
ncbi:MAG: hypothetical protein J2P18_00995 [Nocardia sp.]|nr:hypothetical protein [Nocardia sp.]